MPLPKTAHCVSLIRLISCTSTKPWVFFYIPYVCRHGQKTLKSANIGCNNRQKRRWCAILHILAPCKESWQIHDFLFLLWRSTPFAAYAFLFVLEKYKNSWRIPPPHWHIASWTFWWIIIVSRQCGRRRDISGRGMWGKEIDENFMSSMRWNFPCHSLTHYTVDA